MYSSRTTHSTRQRQRGAVFIVMLVFMIMGVAAFLVSSLNSSALQIQRDQKTADALAQAKEALIGYATSVDLTSVSQRPGDLPCPDTDNDGISGDATYTTCNLQSQRIGRLPWKTLGLPDLRDGSGERLWYAVSNNFKNNTRTICSASGQPGCLNSDTMGTISVFASGGTLLNNGGGSTGAVAVIIAPSDALTRQDNVSQIRGCTLGVDCDATEKCTSASPTTVPKCNPKNYLDIATVSGITEDNANFADNSSIVGFIQGRIKDSNGNIILNDQLIVVSQDNIMQAIQKRVAGEAKQCLNEYALHPQNMGRFPWAVPLTDFTTYLDFSTQLFGRIPDAPFTNTCLASGGYVSGHGSNNCANNPTLGMKNSWTGNCNINSGSGWWLNWKEMVFYGLADGYKPVNPPSTPTTCPNCLTVSPPSSTADKKFVVIVAGKMLPTQTSRPTNQSTLSYYLEPPNSGGATTFAQSGVSATFNDTVVFQ